MTRSEAKAYRSKIDGILKKVTTNAEVLEYADLYPFWSGYVDYAVGSIVRRPSGLYRCYNAITANPTWLPENTAAHWEPITVGEDGTIDNPITAAAGMRYFKDKYYLDGGKTYKCIRDDSNGQGTILHYVPSQLVGIYFEEVTG